MQRGSPAISPFAAIGNIEKFDLTTSFFSSLLDVGNRPFPDTDPQGQGFSTKG
jgi:hypothetical protein